MNKFKSASCDDFYQQSSLDLLIEDAIDYQVSDIHIKSDSYIRFEIYNDFIPISKHKPDEMEISTIVNNLYKSITGSDMVLSGEALDFEYEHRYKKKGATIPRSYLFRVNAASNTVCGRISITVTMRLINEDAPIWDEMSYGDNLWRVWRPKDGLVAVSGKTGSGKSTLLASGLRRILEEYNNEKIITLESPIEYNLHPYERESTMVVQRSVPKNVKTYLKGVEDSLRQHPTIVVVGEARKRHEIEAALLVCITGHLTYITTHTGSVPETAHRLLNEFPVQEQEARMGDIMYSSRLFVNQQLLKSTDGKVVAIREILEFDDTVRNKLLSVKPTDIKKELRKLVGDCGQSFGEHANFYYKQGLITKTQFDSILKYQKAELDL